MEIQKELEEAKKKQMDLAEHINQLAEEINQRTEQRQALLREALKVEGEIRGFTRLANKKD